MSKDERSSSQRAIIVLRRDPNRNQPSKLSSEGPRQDYDVLSQMLGAPIVSADDFDPAKSGPLAARLGKSPFWAATFAALEASRDVGHIYLTSEDFAFRLVPLLKLRGWRGKVHVIVHACRSWRRQAMLRLIGHDLIGSFLTDTSVQAEFLVRGAGIPAEKVHVYINPIDTTFFDAAHSTLREQEDYVFSCGLENRDYATLEAVARLSPRQFRVQASGYFPNLSSDRAGPPENFDLRKTRVPFERLRDLYAGSRIVVVPLNDVPYAAGVTGLVEAMSMGKPVIVTGSVGIRDYTHVPSLVVVPANDPQRMADEIERLWNSPELCRQMSADNIEWARANAHVDDYCRWAAAHMGLTVPQAEREADASWNGQGLSSNSGR